MGAVISTVHSVIVIYNSENTAPCCQILQTCNKRHAVIRDRHVNSYSIASMQVSNGKVNIYLAKIIHVCTILTKLYLAKGGFNWLQLLLNVYIAGCWLPLSVTNTVSAIIHTGFFGLWIYGIIHGTTCWLAVCGASHSLGVFYFKLRCCTAQKRLCCVQGWLRSRVRIVVPGPHEWLMGSWCDSGLLIVLDSGSSPSLARPPNQWLHALSKLTGDSTQAAESFPYLTTLEIFYTVKLQRLPA